MSDDYAENLERVKRAADRVKHLMGFAEGPDVHRFEQIRMLWKRYEAIVVSVEKLEAIADALDAATIETGKYEYALQAVAQCVDEVRHDADYKAVGLLEVPAYVRMLLNELKQLRQERSDRATNAV